MKKNDSVGEPSNTSKAISILLVDNDAGVLAVVDEVLTRSGFDVTATGSSTTAVAMLENADYEVDLMISDYCLDEMTGAELIRRAFRLRPDLRILFISGDPRCVNSFRREDPFLLKPFTPAAMLQKVEDVMNAPAPMRRADRAALAATFAF